MKVEAEVEINEANVLGYERKSVVLLEHHRAHVALFQAELDKVRDLILQMNCEDKLDHLQAIQNLYQWALK